MEIIAMSQGFPPLGRLIRFAFAASGVLPRKRGEQDGMTESEKKAIQKQLERLVNEEGSLVDRHAELVKALAFAIAGTIDDIKSNFAIGETVLDLLEVYQAVIRSDGSYLDERESLKWFARCYAIPRLAMSIQKQLLRFNLSAEGFDTPTDADWFLPTLSSSSIRWPLANAIEWVYAICNMSQTSFHCSGQTALEATPQQRQNLENAADWLKGRRLPSWPALYWNFSTSLSLLATLDDPHDRREITPALRMSIVHVLFLARVSTYVCQSIESAYGAAFLSQLIEQFQRHTRWLNNDLAKFRADVEAYLDETSLPENERDAIWLNASEHYWKWYVSHATEVGSRMHALWIESNGVLSDALVDAWADAKGDHPVRSTIEFMMIARDYELPDGFATALMDAQRLRTNKESSLVDVDRYIDVLRQIGLDSRLSWIEPWLRGEINYRHGDHDAAFTQFEAALARAKYCAGAQQDQIVNRYIELAAKTDRWKCFKSGIEWARYLGIAIRLLRGSEATEENLRAIFAIMKQVHYA
ncbi:hypothetical protein [Burkholderia lata]|uniref:hypothetical protein n=1 Tax=Burkholderia lata (strain ATCC 17760 / DSM 23089 / LMG 22485 / NCIMB 9086 / R18194 / 383) TaxID=482957 RepID=UPI00399A58DB